MTGDPVSNASPEDKESGRLSPKARDNAQWWRLDTTASTATFERMARDALSRTPRARRYAQDAKPKPAHLPGLLEPLYAAHERVWFVEQARHIAWRHYRDMRRRGLKPRQYATTITPPRWLVPTAEFDPDQMTLRVVELKKQLQRWARKLPGGSFAVGAIDVALNRDEQHDLDHWSFHAHMLVIVDAPSLSAGKAIIRRAFVLKANPQLGVKRPVFSPRIDSKRGGALGWLRYASKSMQINGPHRRVVGFDAETGKRKPARKQELKLNERAQWALLAAKLKADHLMVWVGWRRHGDYLRRTHRR